MSGPKLKHALLKKLVIAKEEVTRYLAMRKAKGYMSVSESENLRNNLFGLYHDCREKASAVQENLTEEEQDKLHRAIEAVSSMAVCLMGGRRDCPQYITVDAVKLETGLTTLSQSLEVLIGQAQCC